MARKRETHSLTLMIVPHSQRPPLSFRIPLWVIPTTIVLVLVLVFGFAYLAANNRSLSAQVSELHREQAVYQARDREMRLTILAQQEEVTSLSEAVDRFRVGMLEVENLSRQIRRLIGLEDVVITATATVAPTSYHMGGGQGGSEPGDYSMSLALEAGRGVEAMQAVLPESTQELNLLLDALTARVERIAPEKRDDPEELERQLRLLAAAPKLWPMEGEISSGFGYRVIPSAGYLEFHQGLDIGAWYGTSVRATKAGKVVFAGWRPGLGWTIVLEHELGFSTVYGHNSWYFVDPGDVVEEGQKIALSGDSGRSTGPHLHYEIRLNDVPKDPLIYLSLNEH
ncbi:MAG: peptidoglycan DD-metalloendopeptidase family protein [Anaerolineae bacterium]|nr:peptidoglycan DD-metalloendopeptidase family protein [Anaerolineae bacterium]NIN99797.1 peptidoglycan DD-metalloendopeptidase family protein [Anaerolineae bacterium]NIQ78673.1 peptidoglycan DD-metalloendopeptidase family protein [Anaerolineae bacterium]